MPNGQSICKNENNSKFILYVSKNAKESCTTYKYFICINYLQMYFLKIPLSHVIQLDNNRINYSKIITLACWEMNERFCLATTHDILQDEIEMFAMHPLPNHPRNLPSFV
jgi:hypothetical protein